MSYSVPTVAPLPRDLEAALQRKLDNKIKPAGSLGRLESIAKQIGMIQQSLEPRLAHPTLLVFASDHGIATEGVSAYPPEVTQQMVHNFLDGRGAVNVLARLQGLDLLIVDAGVSFDFQPHPKLICTKVDYGSANMLHQPAMSKRQCLQALQDGSDIATELIDKGCNFIGFGEMGIGNSSSAALLASALCRLPLESCVGMGTGHDEDHLRHKLSVLEKVQATHMGIFPKNDHESVHPFDALAAVGGFEIAQMVGAMLKAASCGITLAINGFISSTAFLLAYKLVPEIKEYAIFSHLSNEQGHRWILECLGVDPLLALDMRLGEASAIAVAYPLIVSSLAILNEMATFESAELSHTNTA